jgi:TPR repeat protein
MPPWDETYRRLLWWTQGRAPSERMAAHIIADAGYKDVIPTHPQGGPDRGADATCTKDGKPCVMAAYFPGGPKPFPTVKNKLEADLNAARKGGREFTGMAFVTNQELTLGQRKTLEALGGDVEIDLFHLERCIHILDLPHMAETKKLYLDIPAGKPTLADPEEPLADLVYPTKGSDLPVVKGLDPYVLGATASMVGNADSYGHADPYVARTANHVDERLDAALTNPPSRSRMVLLVGPSKAGKTRTAFEALRRVLPTARLAAPLPGKLTRLAAHRRWRNIDDTRVVWLDDLYQFLAHADPLTPALLDKLTARSARSGPVVVVATLRSEQRRRLRQQRQAGNGTPQIGEMSRDTRMLLDQAHEIPLRATNEDDTENAAARDAYPRLGLDGGLAAELAGAPELLRQYDDAADSDAVMHVVVQVVIDWDRVGRPDPIPEPVVKTLAKEALLKRRPGLDANDAEFTDAIQTASTAPEGAGQIAMLDPTRDDDGVRQYRPFDYLVAADDGQNHPERAIPDNMWNHALADADPRQLYSVGSAAIDRDNYQTALTAFTRAAHGFAQAAQADNAYEDVSAHTALIVGMLHMFDPPDLKAARTWLERAADAGNSDAMDNLAILYADMTDPPDVDAARGWWERAVDAGNSAVMLRLGMRAKRMDPPDLDAARGWWERAADAGNSDAMFQLGEQAQRMDPPDLDAARRWYQRAADAGNSFGMFGLGFLYMALMDPPDLDAARRWLERAADAGNISTHAMLCLGFLYADMMDPPDLDLARSWWRRAAALGNEEAARKLKELT